MIFSYNLIMTISLMAQRFEKSLPTFLLKIILLKLQHCVNGVITEHAVPTAYLPLLKLYCKVSLNKNTLFCS